MADYATLAQLKARLLQAQASDDAVLALLLTSSSRACDRSLKVPDDFFAVATAGALGVFAKTLTGAGREFIVLPPHVAADGITSIVDEFGRTLLATEYRVTDNFLYALSSKVKVSWLLGARFNVTARWGWTATPSDIGEACLQISARWFRGRDEAWAGVTQVNDQVVIERAIPEAAKLLLKNYKSELIRKGWVNP